MPSSERAYRYTDFSGTATDFDRRQYTYDRNSNRLSIEHTLYKAASHSATYDDLNRLTDFKTGILGSTNVVQLSDVAEGLNMDLLGNFTAAAGGIELNGNTTTVSHGVNETNEITSIGFDNPAGAATIIKEPFTTSLSDIWTADIGTWSISADQVNVDGVTSGKALLLADPQLDIVNTQVKITFPSGSSTAKAGIAFCHDGTDNYYLVVINRSTGKIALHQVTGGSIGGVLASANATIADSTQYTLHVNRMQQRIEATLVGQNSFSYDSSSDFGTGQSGLYSTVADVLFDNFKVYDATARPSLTPGFVGLADASISSGALLVTGSSQGGEAIVDRFAGDGSYIVQVDVNLNSGTEADIWVRRQDANNGYVVNLDSSGNVTLYDVTNGNRSSVAGDTYTTDTSVAVKIKVGGVSAGAIKPWVFPDIDFERFHRSYLSDISPFKIDDWTPDSVRPGNMDLPGFRVNAELIDKVQAEGDSLMEMEGNPTAPPSGHGIGPPTGPKAGVVHSFHERADHGPWTLPYSLQWFGGWRRLYAGKSYFSPRSNPVAAYVTVVYPIHTVT